MTARLAVEQGILRRGIKYRDDRVIWLTLTDTARGSLSLSGLHHQWKATVKQLRRKWGATGYALVREFQARGALHPHACIEVHDQVADDLRDRKSRASYRRRMHELRPLAERLGWGQMVDAVTIDTLHDHRRVSQYAAKSVAGYATKEAGEMFKRAGAKRVRPLSLSRGWVPGGLAAMRAAALGQGRMDETRLEGRWERIPKPRTC